MNIHINCRNCGTVREIDTTLSKVLYFEFCSRKCNEQYFLKEGRGLVPVKFKNKWYLSSCGKAKYKD